MAFYGKTSHKPNSANPSCTDIKSLHLNGIISFVWKILSSFVKGQDGMIEADGRKSFAVPQKEAVVKISEKSKCYLQLSRKFSGFRDFGFPQLWLC